jgi:hypothetical protein
VGQFAGDDSIAPEISALAIAGDQLVYAGAMMGQVLENVEFKRGARGVNYLSRFYTDEVWTGNHNSTCDLPRALAKIHVTLNLTKYTPRVKLEQKLMGLATTDRHTPIIAEILDAAIRVGMTPGRIKLDRQIVSWWSRFDLTENWPNEGVSDPGNWIETFLPGADVAPLFAYLMNVTNVDQLLTLPAIQVKCALPPNNKASVVVDDEIFIVEPVTAEVKHQVNNICKRFIKGECTFGIKCKFKHVRVCKDYINGTCNRPKCKFEHIKL